MNKKFKISLLFCLIAGGVFYSYFFVFSYGDKITHPALTEQSAILFNKTAEKKLPDQAIEWLKKGSIEEDAHPRYINHFYDPIYKTALKNGVASDSTGTLYLAKTAIQWAHSSTRQSIPLIGRGDYSWEAAIYYYQNGEKEKAYIALGHILHLLEDMAVPAHTRDDGHGLLEEPYETWVDEYIKNNKINFSDISPANCNSLDQCFSDLAFYTNTNFFSKDTINSKKYNLPKITKNVTEKGILYGHNNIKIIKIIPQPTLLADILPPLYEIDDPEIHKAYFNNLAPKAVSYGAGVIDLFFKEVNQQPEAKQGIFSKVFNVIGDALTKPIIKNKDIDMSQLAIVSQPFKEQDKKNESQKIEEQKEIELPEKEKDWQHIETKDFSIKIPASWDIIKNTKKNVAFGAVYQKNAYTINATVEIFTEDLKMDLDIFSWVKKHFGDVETETLNVDNIQGAGFKIEIPIEYVDGDKVVNEYMRQVNAVFIIDKKVMRLLCEVGEDDYSKYIQECNNIIETFKPTKAETKQSPQASAVKEIEQKQEIKTKEDITDKKTPIEQPKQAEEKQNQPAPDPEPQTPKMSPPTISSDNKTQLIPTPILVTDQFNEPIENAKIWMEDDRGITYPSGYWRSWSTDKKGQIYFQYTPEGEGAPDGNFTVHIEKQNYTLVKEEINILSNSDTKTVKISPNKFTLRKWGIITALVVTESGDSVRGAAYNITNDRGEYINEFGKKTDDSFFATRYATTTGRLETFPLPDGKYTLNISCEWRCGFDALYLKTLEVEVSGSEVWLNKIILQKEK